MSLLQKPRRYGIPKSISNVNNSPDQKVKGDINIISNNNNQEIIKNNQKVTNNECNINNHNIEVTNANAYNASITERKGLGNPSKNSVNVQSVCLYFKEWGGQSDNDIHWLRKMFLPYEKYVTDKFKHVEVVFKQPTEDYEILTYRIDSKLKYVTQIIDSPYDDFSLWKKCTLKVTQKESETMLEWCYKQYEQAKEINNFVFCNFLFFCFCPVNRKQNSFFCSEFIAHMLVASENPTLVKLFKGKEHKVRPLDVYNILKENNMANDLESLSSLFETMSILDLSLRKKLTE